MALREVTSLFFPRRPWKLTTVIWKLRTMKDETDTRIKMKLFAVTFLAKLKALLLLSSITTGIIIIFFMEHGLSYQGYLPIRLVLKSRQSNMYGDYFAYETSKRDASILIIVLSATVKYERREGIRKTWWKDCQKYDQVTNCLTSYSYGNDSIVFQGSILWNYLPNEIKSQTSVCSFKKRIKNWSGVDCNCTICK